MKKKQGKQLNPGQVIIPVGHPNPPEPHEVDAAFVLARHFRCIIEFLQPVDDYKRKTADILMLGVLWEIKSPIGASNSTISNQFRVASKQARNIIIDTRRTALDYDQIEKEVQRELRMRAKTKRVILIDKFEKVIEIHK